MALSLQRLGLGEAHQLLALGLRRGEQKFTVGHTASLLAHGIGFTWPGERTELAEPRHHRSLILADENGDTR